MTDLTVMSQSARLPTSYEHARRALAECVQLDECKTWADKAAALASYAKQSEDEELEKYAVRVRLRAVRRVGELLQEIKAGKGGRPAKTGGGAATSFRGAAASEAGLSKDQAIRAIRVASVPEDEFDAAVEAYRPATVTELADMGLKARRRHDPALGSKAGREPGLSDERYTRSAYIEAARRVMGSIDLDPASCDLANETVRATTYYTQDTNGLHQPWFGNVWLNPPYSQPLASQFAARLVEAYLQEAITGAVMLQNSSTDTKWFHRLASLGTVCFPEGRINFDTPDGDQPDNNRYAQVFFYFGSHPDRFEREFSEFGLVGTLRRRADPAAAEAS